jgi:ribonucleotide monophosphatase NagD (HAD superfamily)
MANEAGMASALVLTGATDLEETLSSQDRPDYIIGGLGELLPASTVPYSEAEKPREGRGS